MTLWEIDIHPADRQPDHLSHSMLEDIADLGLAEGLALRAAHGFLIQSNESPEKIEGSARRLLVDAITERSVIAPVGTPSLNAAPPGFASTGTHVDVVTVLPKPGVMDPVADSTLAALRDAGLDVEAVRTFRKYWIAGADSGRLDRLCSKVLANDSVEQALCGPLKMDQLGVGSPYQLQLHTIPLRTLGDEALVRLSREGQLSLSLIEMQTIQNHFRDLGRDPTDIELETIAQTWSEHCSHKTLAGRIDYQDERGSRQFRNMLKETIFAATVQIREKLAGDDWCVKVFQDNAGIVRFDDQYHVVFKVETHNHPSAIEPYGGANTGLGGVIRDPLGTGLGAKPVCNTDVFCFGLPDTSAADLPPGVLHPRRVMKGVVSGVRDYGNRMGIPTVNGAVFFDQRYLGNPLVFCGNVGLLPVDCAEKAPQPGDWIVALGGRTGRDGIHGATFSSVELTEASESISGGAVQIGNAITEKMVLDVLLRARDEKLFHAVTDCGAGGFSSAVGEMGETIGAEVWLDRAPLKYEGLSYTEIWISEAQERMVLAVPPKNWDRFQQLAASEGVEATIIGTFTPTGRLRLMYDGNEVGCLTMEFLHGGRPPVVRKAIYQPPKEQPLDLPQPRQLHCESTLAQILGSPNVASKHWIIRQYDHEVQGGSVVKPLVGIHGDGPSDAAVIRPRLESRRGLVISCGMNPRLGDYDPYHMAASAIDEAMRNAVAVGADPKRIAILDNFCWGNTDRPETLGTLVRAALGCHDLAVEWNTPFISGKDSLYNEFTWADSHGKRQTIAIPSTLLISAIGQIDSVDRCVTMDLKRAGNRIYLVGTTREEFGGSHYALVHQRQGGKVPRVDASMALRLYQQLHQSITSGLLRSCHDLSEGGLAVAASEMAFSGGLGVELEIDGLCQQQFVHPLAALFSESNSRLLCEVPVAHVEAFERQMKEIPHVALGFVTEDPMVKIAHRGAPLIALTCQQLRQAWWEPLDWT
ncbi:MAG: phosphoribosylformylglycinamidine synthase subunit PurL [Pirellulaceae bacterium]